MIEHTSFQIYSYTPCWCYNKMGGKKIPFLGLNSIAQKNDC